MVVRGFPPLPNVAQADISALSRVCIGKLSGENSGTEQVNSFKKLFDEGLELTRSQAFMAVSPLNLESLLRSGLLEEVQENVRACLKIQYYKGLIFLSDFFRWESDPDFVLPIGPAGRYLADLTIRREVNNTLDLGCGCGVQSLLAARHSVTVFATDINPRALALTRLNAALNGISNIETLEGSYFEPVGEKKFELIVANLPYVITPESRFVYRDVDQPGDASIRKWLQDIPPHLKEDGYAHLLLHWIIEDTQFWDQPIQSYLKNLPLDAWLIYNGSKNTDEYSEIWIDQETKENLELFKHTRQEWLRWYQEQGIQQIGLGTLALRRRSRARNWFRAIPVLNKLEGSAGEQFTRLFSAQDYLDSLGSKQDLLRALLCKVNVEFAPEEEQSNVVFSSKEMHIQVTVHPATMAVLRRLDGQTELQAALEMSNLNTLESGLNTPKVFDDVEMLIQLGMIVPIELVNMNGDN